MAKPIQEPEFVSLNTVSKLLNVNSRTVHKMAMDGRLAHIQLGQMIRIPIFEVERLREEARRSMPPAKQSQRENVT